MCVCASRIYVQICSTISNSKPWNSPIIGSSSFLAVKSLKDRGESQQNGVAVQRERESSDLVWTLNGILIFTPREAFLEGNCKSFWFPMKENILKELCLCGAYSSCHRAKGRETPRTQDCSHSRSDPIESFESAVNPTSMWEANSYEQSENMQTLQRSSVRP